MPVGTINFVRVAEVCPWREKLRDYCEAGKCDCKQHECAIYHMIISYTKKEQTK